MGNAAAVCPPAPPTGGGVTRREAVRLAVVGCGRIGGTYLDVASTIPEARLAAVVDDDPSARDRAAERPGVRGFAGVADLVASGEAEAAVVCTPPATHAPIVSELLGAGLHVICEKPFALT